MKLNPKALLLSGLAAVGAFLLAAGSTTPAYEDQLLKVAVHQSFGDLAPQVAEEPPEIQASSPSSSMSVAAPTRRARW